MLSSFIAHFSPSLPEINKTNEQFRVNAYLIYQFPCNKHRQIAINFSLSNFIMGRVKGKSVL